MLKKKIYFILLILYLLTTIVFSAEKAFIQILVDKEIITNVDIKKESDYLKILNPNLSTLDEKRINEIAKKSLITEIIKNKEIEKYIVNNENNELQESLLENLYKRLNLSKSEFQSLLIQKKNYSLSEIKKKLMIDILWNDLIYYKFKDQVKVDSNKLLAKIESAALRDKKEYLLSEIIFEKNVDQNLNELINKIKTSINEIGFNNTANIYSISETSKFGGKIGWVDETSLSNIINQNLQDKKKNQYTDIIQVGNNFLILMIDDIKFTKITIDKDLELKKLIDFEMNRQLNQFSKIYFNKSKINYIINEK
jgi:peptidyl-prolyl cis-trans isomerase SurA